MIHTMYSVSYTHLDVYKRQYQYGAGLLHSGYVALAVVVADDRLYAL